MTDSSEDNEERLQYLKANLLQANNKNTPSRSKAKGYGLDDDDSNNLFMSEPSVSEADDLSDHHMRLLSPLGSFTEDERGHEGPDYLRPPPPPPARLLAPSSPENTSLSSWESPHLHQHRIHLHFSPGGDSLSHKAETSVYSNPQQQQQHSYSQRNPSYHNHLPPNLQHSDPYLASGLIPPSSGPRTPERSYVHSSNSTSPASEGQRQRLESFLDDLRVSSQGQVREANNMSLGSSTYRAVPTDLNDVVQPRHQPRAWPHSKQQPQQHSRISSIDTARRQNTSVSSEGTGRGRTDETVVMVLSDDSADETKGKIEAAAKTGSLDWEEKMSADDEKTTEGRQYRTIRTARSHGAGGRGGGAMNGKGHRRQRSGDAAAATLSTGSKEWKGMEQDKIPLPPLPGGHDDDEDDDDEHAADSKAIDGPNRSIRRQVDTANWEEGIGDDEAIFSTGQARSPEKQDIFKFSQFALGTGGQEGQYNQRRSSRGRHRRDISRGRRTTGPILDSEDSSSLASRDASPHESGSQTPHHVAHASLPASAFTGYMASPDWSIRHTGHHVRKGSHPLRWSPQSYNSETTSSLGMDHIYDYDHAPITNPSWQAKSATTVHPPFPQRTFSGDYMPGRVNMHVSHPANSADIGIASHHTGMDVMGAWGHKSSETVGRPFSWVSSGRSRDNSDPSFFPSSEMSPLISTGIKTYNVKSQSNPIVDSVSPSYELQPQEPVQNKRTANYSPLLESGKMVFESSPFSNIGKALSKNDRSRFLPASGLDENDKRYSTFVCPVCNTRQREFFTVTNAPRQFESASGYIAFYFGIYVIAALYIFGLQEGWGKLDCIYFAVITLTTAGLGDFVPTSDGAKVVCSIFIYFGVACIGLLLGSYIAGMLDESSRRAARANRIKSCPNCVRIQNIRDAAKRRRKQFRRERKMYERHHSRAEQTTVGNAGPLGHDSKRLKRQHVESLHDHAKGLVSSERPMGSPPVALNGDLFQKSSSSEWGQMSPRGVQHSSTPATHPITDESTSSITLPLTMQSRQYTPSSPSTRRILRRQTHSRHASIDMHGSHFSGGFGMQTAPRRKYSADLGVPATILEVSGTQNKTSDSPPAPLMQPDQCDNGSSRGTSSKQSGDENNNGDDVESSTYSSDNETSSDSSESLDLEDQFNGVKNARYVFLTLREALINSLVIIGTGCFGFYFIEGFSFIDSWYFTTVLLTTVGYGDLVPYTKGGKLFATVYILVAGTILLNNMSMISMIPLELRRRRTEKAVLTQFGDALDDSALRELATGPLVRRLNLATNQAGGLDECTREMFCLAMLVRLGKVTEEDIKLTFAAFKKLDVNNEKVLNSRAIIAGMIQKRRSSLHLNKMNGNASKTISNQSGQSQTSYASMPLYSWGTGLGSNVFVPTATPTNEVSSMGGTFDSTTPENASSVTSPQPGLTSPPLWNTAASQNQMCHRRFPSR